MAAPRIGIPLGLDTEGRLRAGRRTLYLDVAYADAVSAAGGSPRLLSAPADPRALISEVDALLIPGGDDFLPETPYPAEVSFQAISASQLGFDRALLAAGLDADLPILGVCYGMQLLALARGGRLHHHLPHDVPGSSEHGATGRTVRHPVTLEPRSRVAEIFEAEQITVDSRHHQAVADPGDLHVSGRAPDGVIEAIEGPTVLGVQWHPETMGGEHAQRLFGALVAAASQSVRTR